MSTIHSPDEFLRPHSVEAGWRRRARGVEHDAGDMRGLQLAARDATSRARLLADALERLAAMVDVALRRDVGERAPRQEPPHTAESLWTVDQVATYLGVSTGWVRRAATSGRLPSAKIGGARRFIPEEIRAHARGAAASSMSARVIPRQPRRSRPPGDS